MHVQGVNIIERAFQLAAQCGSIDQVREALKREGYAQVDAHLAGLRIRSDIRSRLNPDEVEKRAAARNV